MEQTLASVCVPCTGSVPRGVSVHTPRGFASPPWMVPAVAEGELLKMLKDKAAKPPPSPLMRNLKDILAGTCGGIAVCMVGHPFDTVKVLLQTQPQKNPVYAGVLDCARKTIKSDGFLGLYKGVSSPLAGQMAFRASLFLSYGVCKDIVGANPDDPLSYAKAGSMAWGFATLAESPIDFYKSQMQKELVAAKINPNHVPEHRSIVSVVKSSFQLNGAKGPFQGYSATLARNIPAAALYFGTFENTKLFFVRRSGAAAPTSTETFVSAGIAGFMYWVAFYPTDVVKSAMMTDSMDPAKRKFPSITKTVSTLYAEGGVRRFYTGLAPCLIRAVPANAVMLTTVEFVGKLLSKAMDL